MRNSSIGYFWFSSVTFFCYATKYQTFAPIEFAVTAHDNNKLNAFYTWLQRKMGYRKLRSYICINILFRLIAIKLTSISKSDCIIQPCTSSLSISITKCLFEFSLRKILGWKYWRKTMMVRVLFVAGIIYFTIILKTNIYLCSH